MKKPTLRFSNQSLAELRKYAEQIFDRMSSAQDTFVTPIPSMETLRQTIQQFSESISEAAFNDHRAIIYRNQKKEELKAVIYELSRYVDGIAKGDEVIILSAGFIPTKDTVRGTTVTPKAYNLIAVPQGLGTSSVLLSVNPWAKIRFYQFEYRKKDGTEMWQSVLSSRSLCKINNLEAFKQYEFRVTYLGKDAIPNYSDIISTYAL